jgi:hypothetical protein
MNGFKVALNVIDLVLSGLDENSRKLANILTALRGPDGVLKPQAKAIKDRLTAPIRAAAFPILLNTKGRDEVLQWTMTGKHDGKIYQADLDAYVKLTDDKHFIRHIIQAAEALGIEIVPLGASSRTLQEALDAIR